VIGIRSDIIAKAFQGILAELKRSTE